MADHDADPPENQADENQADGNLADENQNEKVWKLKDVKMTVGVYGKRRAEDSSMVVDLVFEFEDDPTPKVVGELNKIFLLDFFGSLSFLFVLLVFHF